MGKRLQTVENHVTDIVISTATVDIQVIRIGTKQMTLAVFRQLPHKTIYRKSGALLAPPWGWVNYDREGGGTPFVFSYEGVLYRYDAWLHVERRLVVKPERREESIDAYWDEGKCRYISKEWRLTGSWNVLDGESGGHLLTFDSEKDALAHLANRRESLRVLEAAPQLFIGV
jgi:hypothetical protein